MKDAAEPIPVPLPACCALAGDVQHLGFDPSVLLPLSHAEGRNRTTRFVAILNGWRQHPGGKSAAWPTVPSVRMAVKGLLAPDR